MEDSSTGGGGQGGALWISRLGRGSREVPSMLQHTGTALHGTCDLNQRGLRQSIGDLPSDPSFDYMFGEALHVVNLTAAICKHKKESHVDDGVDKANRQNEPC